MERTLRVYVRRGGGVVLCDSVYGRDVAALVSDEVRRKAEEVVEENKPPEPFDLFLCGELKADLDAVEFLTHVLNLEIKSKTEMQAGLEKVIVDLEKKSIENVSGEELLREAKRRGLI